MSAEPTGPNHPTPGHGDHWRWLACAEDESRRFTGHNLVFLVGVPRSGTTWLQRAIVTLFQGFEHLEPERVPAGIRGLEEVLRRARKLGHPDIVRYYKRQVGRSVPRQSVYQARLRHPVGRTLLTQALLWSPRVAVARDVAKPVTRFLLPPAVQKVLRFGTRG